VCAAIGASCCPLGTRTDPIRFATFNASLFRGSAGQLIRDLGRTDDQIRRVAEIIQRVRPNVLLIDEFDYDEAGKAAELFQARYLNVGQNGADPILYPYVYIDRVNNGIPSGHDLDNNGVLNEPTDMLGYGLFEGQYGMVVYSTCPILFDEIRTFRTFLWKDMPDALLPVDPSTGHSWFSSAERAILPLSSKSHWDVPIRIGERVVHVLASHPTPPVFDGPEDRNGTRNHDEIRFWADYVTPEHGDYIYDDEGHQGGLAAGAHFVVMGDQNADPYDGDSIPEAIWHLLDSPLVNTSVTPSSDGATRQSALQGGVNASHQGDPQYDTADWNDAYAGNLRSDYVLPSITLDIVDAGVFWPVSSDPLYRLVRSNSSSDHRLVWVDIAF